MSISATSSEEIYRGIPASPGIIIGAARSFSRNHDLIAPEPIDDPEAEVRMFRAAMAQVRRALETLTASVLQKHGREFARIFDAQAMIAGDEVWNQSIERRILAEKMCAEYIYDDEARKVIAKLEEAQDSYLKERIQDIQAVTSRLVAQMRGERHTTMRGLKDSTVVVARYLLPSDILAMSFGRNLGFATGVGGPTSHAALMAKSLGIPAVIGLGEIAEDVPSGTDVVIDGYSGFLILNPAAATIRKYRKARSAAILLKRQLAELKTKEAVTKDGVEIKVQANIEIPGEVSKVLSAGASGIGLFRTEYLFLTRSDFPTSDEQYDAYAEVLRRMKGKPVVIRTFDMGGDKFPDSRGTLLESNPFLGWRAIRFCLDRPAVFKVQLRAMLMASRYGNLSILIPMISNYDELMATKRIIAECRGELHAEGVRVAEKIPLGIMLEVPSAVIIADHLAREVDFFSIGTNDLIQYTVAVDRDHEMLSRLYQSFHPAVLSLIAASVKAAHRHRKPVAVCGEMAADPLAAVLLVGLGVDELSASFQMTGILKKIIRSITYSGARRIASRVWKMRTHQEIEAYLKEEIMSSFPSIAPVIQFTRRNSDGGLPAA
jgi:phosphotransferase system enzyme I (PtsI)